MTQLNVAKKTLEHVATLVCGITGTVLVTGTDRRGVRRRHVGAPAFLALQNGKRIATTRVTTRSVGLKLPKHRVERLARVLRRAVRERGRRCGGEKKGLEYDHGDRGSVVGYTGSVVGYRGGVMVTEAMSWVALLLSSVARLSVESLSDDTGTLG